MTESPLICPTLLPSVSIRKTPRPMILLDLLLDQVGPVYLLLDSFLYMLHGYITRFFLHRIKVRFPDQVGDTGKSGGEFFLVFCES